MEKKQRKKKRDYDRNVTAFRVVQEATKELEPVQAEELTLGGRDPNAVALGQKGGKARAKKLTPEQRSEIGRKAAQTRWAK